MVVQTCNLSPGKVEEAKDQELMVRMGSMRHSKTLPSPKPKSHEDSQAGFL